MSELSFEQMLEDSVKTIRNGEIVQGKVIDVKEDEIILNIGYKADAESWNIARFVPGRSSFLPGILPDRK